MPDWQMQQVLQTSLGETWADNFISFDRTPFAAASIGQVHHAVLAPSQSPSGGGGGGGWPARCCENPVP
jgi:aarF domain-containing kinase